MPDALGTLAVGLAAGSAGWFGTNFLGRPVVALRECRLQALQTAERYAHVDNHASDALRQRALSALHDSGNALRAYARERSLATRVASAVWRYDIDYASRALFRLAEAARGQYQYSDDIRRTTLHAVFVSLNATNHLSAQEIETARTEIARWQADDHG